MPFQLAQVNIATLLAPPDDPLVAPFMDALPHVNALAEASPGYVWRLQTEDGDATAIQAFPNPLTIVNLTVWESVSALREFAYRTEHADFFRRRGEWFAREGRAVVLWWVPTGHRPTVEEAKERIDHLAAHGPSPRAFTFATVHSPPDPAPGF